MVCKSGFRNAEINRVRKDRSQQQRTIFAKAVVLSIDAIASPEFSQGRLLFRGSRRKSSRDAGQSLNSLYTSLSLEPQSFDAGSEGRGLHAEQFRRTPWAKDLAAGLLECCSDAVAFLALQFVARQQSRF
jgi:hypothetical protein